jgi:transposase InsO family protein
MSVETSVSKYMARNHKPASQTWKTFLDNHLKTAVSVDFFTVPTIRFQILYVFLVLAHDRRRILHVAVTAHPTAEWTAPQLREAFPWGTAPQYLLRDRDRIFGREFTEQLKDMAIREVLGAPRVPQQRAYIERVIGSIRRECLDHLIVFDQASLLRHLKSFLNYYHGRARTWRWKRTRPSIVRCKCPRRGRVVAIPQVGGLHHRYERRAA